MKQQENYIKEMELYIHLLEEENTLQKQLIERLEEENRMLQEHYEKYVETVHRMMDGFQ